MEINTYWTRWLSECLYIFSINAVFGVSCVKEFLDFVCWHRNVWCKMHECKADLGTNFQTKNYLVFFDPIIYCYIFLGCDATKSFSEWIQRYTCLMLFTDKRTAPAWPKGLLLVPYRNGWKSGEPKNARLCFDDMRLVAKLTTACLPVVLDCWLAFGFMYGLYECSIRYVGNRAHRRISNVRCKDYACFVWCTCYLELPGVVTPNKDASAKMSDKQLIFFKTAN